MKMKIANQNKTDRSKNHRPKRNDFKILKNFKSTKFSLNEKISSFNVFVLVT